MKRVGILALQGDFDAHSRALAACGAEPVLVRVPSDLGAIDGLVLPGGESTTMLKLLHGQNLFEPVRQFAQEKPVFGTCAGLILLSGKVSNPTQESLGALDVSVQRNGYGRQIDSSVAAVQPSGDFEARTAPGPLESVFIRAPIITGCGPDVRVLASWQDQPVLVEQNGHLAATFHPELTSDRRVHQLFLSKL